ncbi:MAG: hypothetical protein AUI92_02260 [Thaumarchaeota archaeon 13_1_40CM_3_38_6]|nr:MAG: hypothetical protein AUI92_02260 [Thaumarchaeota archaeon 13_1_40CM_3_38_6]
MSSKLPVVLFLIVVLVASVTVATLPVANALTRNAFNDSHTTARFGNSKVCGDHICAPGEHEKMSTELNTAQRNAQAGRATTPSTTPTAPAQTTPPAQNMPQGQNMPQTMPTMVSPMWTTKTGTIASVQDPGQGHENHQLAVILPPSDKIYSGVISWTSSEPLQIVELTGPLGQGDDKGQPIWTTDGKTKFALTLVNVNQTTGSFSFTGNALAVHYPYPSPFTVSYAVSYMESSASDMVKTGTLTSVQDPGQGHESHQLALILPPSDKPYHGILTYSASEPVQLVSLVGPIDPADKKGQLVYTIDGKTWFALVFVDPGAAMGTWEFSGNALAVHTMHTTPFQVSYTVDAHN